VARIASRNARLYLAIASNGTAEPVSAIKCFEINANTDKYDATCFGDSTKTYVVGLPDSQGSFGGIYDTAQNPTFTAAQDGVARKWYFYPDATVNTSYWFGSAFFDFATKFDVAGMAEVSGSWNAATPTYKV